MLKKVILILLSLCLILSISALAENEISVTLEAVPEVSEQIPQGAGENPQGEQWRMGMPPSGERPAGGTPPNMPEGEMPPEGMNRGQRPSGNFNPSQTQGEFTPPQGGFSAEQNNDININNDAASQRDGETSTENSRIPEGNPEFNGQMPGGRGDFFNNTQNFNGQTQEEMPAGFLGFIKTYSTPIISIVLLGLAFIFVIFYKRAGY